ncbi:hypothetical protein [Microvirga aerilata]|uniref:hypothetical protein n=1 Tax=Microvirga aerilata TaxID=670292 RepID=UPI001FE78FAF|nr:hypothetical protein [Microvirga aerilata]
MNQAVLDCLVEDYEELIEGLQLPDPDDRHVLAAAIASASDAIVTFNLKDFPVGTLHKYNIELQHPDDFLHYQFGLNHAGVVIAAKNCRARLEILQRLQRITSPFLRHKAYQRLLQNSANMRTSSDHYTQAAPLT